jgi:hypothetical protein
LIKVLNPTVRAIIGTPISRVLPKWMAVIEVKGRKSGAQRRIPCGVHEVNGVPRIFTDRPWRLNFRGGVPVTVVQQGTRRTGRAELNEDPQTVAAEFGDALKQLRPSELGVKVAKGHEPTTAEIATLGKSMITITLDGS